MLVSKYWERTALVLYSGGLKVLDQVEKILAGHRTSPASTRRRLIL